MHVKQRSWSGYSTIWTLLLQDEGQDLIEYALMVALIAFAATAGMQAAAGGVNTVFATVAATLSRATG
jgi:pilus assembly protein Flp/PilA